MRAGVDHLAKNADRLKWNPLGEVVDLLVHDPVDHFPDCLQAAAAVEVYRARQRLEQITQSLKHINRQFEIPILMYLY